MLFEEDLVEDAANGTQHCEVRTSTEEEVITTMFLSSILPPVLIRTLASSRHLLVTLAQLVRQGIGGCLIVLTQL